ncbi:MAG: hypothetical protein ABFD49_08320 [Armatimonadota bacterium]|nr:hypothetical protein [bacterium]
MKPITRCAVSVLLLLICAQVGSWAGVQATWTDAVGNHVVDLALASNPEYTADLSTVEPLLCWQVSIDIVMASDAPIVLDFSGNFYGGTTAYNLGAWNLIRVEQNVKNATGYKWDGFEITCSDPNPDPTPATNTDTSFYNVAAWSPHWSDVFMDTQCVTYSRLEGEDTDYVENGSYFYDVAKVYADTDGNDDGGVILTKQAHMVLPEPGSCMAVFAGLIGMIGFIKRQ